MSTFTTLLWIICVLNTISKSLSFTDYTGEPCVYPRVSSVFSSELSGITLNCSFWSHQLSWYFNHRLLSGSVGSTDGGKQLHLSPPLKFGTYSCFDSHCNHTFYLRPCPRPKLVIATSPRLQLNCSLFGPKILWTYNHYRLVEFDFTTHTARGFGAIPPALYTNLSTHYASGHQLRLFSPFVAGKYSCSVNSCEETFTVVNDAPITKPITTDFFRHQVVLFTDSSLNITLTCLCPQHTLVTWSINQTLWLAYLNEELVVRNFDYIDILDISSSQVELFPPFYHNTTISCEVLGQPCKSTFKFVYLPPHSVKLIENYNTPILAPKTFYHWITYAGLFAIFVFFLINIFICCLPSSLFSQVQLPQKDRSLLL